MQKKGMSSIVATLLIILLVLILSGILWGVIKNVIKNQNEQISLGKLTLDLKIIGVQINETHLNVTIKRDIGKGEMAGVYFVAYDKDNSEIVIYNVSMEQLEQMNFQIELYVLDTNNVEKITVAPIFKLKSGKEVIGDVKDEYKLIWGTSSTNGGSEGGSPGGGGGSGGGSGGGDSGCTANEQCNDHNVCTGDFCSAGICSYDTIEECISHDGCCPRGCTILNDYDCLLTYSCGDDFCNGNEDCGTCPLDCGVCNYCEELTAPPVCGDGICAGNGKGGYWIGPEDCSNCPQDCTCSSICGDGICGLDETCDGCFSDCRPSTATCGDGTCGTGEDCSNCDNDCGVCSEYCGDGICNFYPSNTCERETSNPFPDLGAFESCPLPNPYCPQDCGKCTFICGNDYCDLGESAFDCSDCSSAPTCGDGYCKVGTETSSNCPADCGASCTREMGCNYDQVCNNGVCGGYRSSCDIFNTSVDLSAYPYNKYGQRIVPEGDEIRIYFNYHPNQAASCDQDMWNMYVCEYNLRDTSGWACDIVNGYMGSNEKYLHPNNYIPWTATMSRECSPSYEYEQEFFIASATPSGLGAFSVPKLRTCTFNWNNYAYLGTNTETMPSEHDPRFFTIIPSSCYGENIPETCEACITTPGYSWCGDADRPPFCTDKLNECGFWDGNVITTCPTCSDGVQNQGETDVDCGGQFCLPCVYGEIPCTSSTYDCPYISTLFGYLDNIDCIQGTCRECDASTSGLACTSHEFPWTEGTCAMRPSDDYWICNRWGEIVYDVANDVHLMYCRSDTIGDPCMNSETGGGDFVQTGVCISYGVGAYCGESAENIDTTQLETRIHQLINEERIDYNLNSLAYDNALASVARAHSQDMADNNYFSHINLDGLNPTERGELQGYYCPTGIGENIYRHNYIPGNIETIATQTVDGWMNSPGHMTNILTPTFSQEGIGVVISYDNRIYITENFC